MHVTSLDIKQGSAGENSNPKARGLYIITIPGIEEDKIRDWKVWHNSVSWHNRHRGNWKWRPSVFHLAYAGIIKKSSVYDAGACDSEGKSLPTYSKNKKRNLQAREWGPLACNFYVFSVKKIG